MITKLDITKVLKGGICKQSGGKPYCVGATCSECVLGSANPSLTQQELVDFMNDNDIVITNGDD